MPERTPDIIVAHVPVLHAGYMELFKRYGAVPIGILDKDVLSMEPYLRKDIRALEPGEVNEFLQGIGTDSRLLGRTALRALGEEDIRVVMPDEDISRKVATAYLRPEQVAFERTFLRWHRDNVKANIELVPENTVEYKEIDYIVDSLRSEADKSSNMWRHVAAALVDENQDILHIARNSARPTDLEALYAGDPRNVYKRGDNIDTSIDIHAEAAVISSAAKEGTPTHGKVICVTTFPCPTCAKLIANAGIRECYYIDGYAVLDGESVLRSAGVKITKVINVPEFTSSQGLRAYPPSTY